MRSRVLPYLGWVVAGVLLVVGGVTRAHSQAPFPAGAFVRGQDGSQWVVAGGRRYAIAWLPDDMGTLPRLSRGPDVSMVGQLNEAIAAAAVPAPPSAPACNTTPQTTVMTAENSTTTTTINYNGVQGLVQQVVTINAGADSGTVTNYSIPAWLQAAYGGNIEAIYRDLATGTLANRCGS